METRQPCRPAGIFGRSQPACLTFLWLVTSFCSHCRHAVDPTELQMSQSARKFKAISSSSAKQLCCVGLEKSYDWRPEWNIEPFPGQLHLLTASHPRGWGRPHHSPDRCQDQKEPDPKNWIRMCPERRRPVYQRQLQMVYRPPRRDRCHRSGRGDTKKIR